MAETFRRSKIERFIKLLEDELTDLEASYRDSDPHHMGLYYDGCLKTTKSIIAKLRREFKMKQEDKHDRMEKV